MIIYETQPQVQVEEEVQGGGGRGGFGNSLGYFEGKKKPVQRVATCRVNRDKNK